MKYSWDETKRRPPCMHTFGAPKSWISKVLPRSSSLAGLAPQLVYGSITLGPSTVHTVLPEMDGTNDLTPFGFRSDGKWLRITNVRPFPWLSDGL